MSDFERLRETMVSEDIAGRGITDQAVLSAMRRVPRELFVPKHLAAFAYDDEPLPIGADQTISQPYIVAYMIAALRLTPADRVLEIGAGSGYAAAVLAEVVEEVFAIERIDALAKLARSNLARAGYSHVKVRHADGTRGWPEEAPFDAILVSAGASDDPELLLSQLTIGGRMVVPVGARPHTQTLFRFVREADGTFTKERLAPVRFVPLVGDDGWSERTGSQSK